MGLNYRGHAIETGVSARDHQMATSQWTMGKSFDTFAPMRPWIVTGEEIGELRNPGAAERSRL